MTPQVEYPLVKGLYPKKIFPPQKKLPLLLKVVHLLRYVHVCQSKANIVKNILSTVSATKKAKFEINSKYIYKLKGEICLETVYFNYNRGINKYNSDMLFA